MVSNEDIYNLLTQFQKDIKEEIRSFRKETKQRLEDLDQKNADLRQENILLRNRLLTTERKLKKYNIVIYGLCGNETETTDIVLKLFNEKLNVRCSRNQIRDIYRFGKTENKKPRPILVEFVTYQIKLDILKNTRKLKGSGIYIAQDHTTEDYQKLKYLNIHLKAAREKHYDAKIKNYALIVNGERYSYEYLKAKNQVENQEHRVSEEIHDKHTAPPTDEQGTSASAPATPAPQLDHFFESLCNTKTTKSPEKINDFSSPLQTKPKEKEEEKKRKLEITPSKETGTKPKIQLRDRSKSRTNKTS